jgi:hypothetical protein
MAETDPHRSQMIALITALENFFRDDPTVYVSGKRVVQSSRFKVQS